MTVIPNPIPIIHNPNGQKVLPTVYDESLSYEQQVAKLREYVNEVIKNSNDFGEVLTELQQGLKEVNTTDQGQADDIKELQETLEKIKNGEYADMYVDSMDKWVDNNMPGIVSRIVRYVSFGLTADGYFVAYIPTSWQFLQFNTIKDPCNPLYGHLVLQW